MAFNVVFNRKWVFVWFRGFQIWYIICFRNKINIYELIEKWFLIRFFPKKWVLAGFSTKTSKTQRKSKILGSSWVLTWDLKIAWVLGSIFINFWELGWSLWFGLGKKFPGCPMPIPVDEFFFVDIFFLIFVVCVFSRFHFRFDIGEFWVDKSSPFRVVKFSFGQRGNIRLCLLFRQSQPIFSYLFRVTKFYSNFTGAGYKVQAVLYGGSVSVSYNRPL